MMDMNEYALEGIAHGRIAEMRAEGERQHRLEHASAGSGPLRVALGTALVRIGLRLSGHRGDAMLGDAGSRP
jgi:hypothetical protein